MCGVQAAPTIVVAGAAPAPVVSPSLRRASATPFTFTATFTLPLQVGLVLTGVVPYIELNVADPIAVAVNAGGPGYYWLRPVVKLGALLGLTSVILVLILGQSRIWFAMADDRMLPPRLAAIHPKYQTPHIAVAICGVIAAVMAGLIPIDILGEMVSHES